MIVAKHFKGGAGSQMNVALKELRPNPFRDFKRCPLMREKVEKLKQSIRETSFWDNLLGRRVNGCVELAYGHHRRQALLELAEEGAFGGHGPQLEMVLRPLDDATMIRIMAAENLVEFRPTTEILDDTVRAARDFLLRTKAVPEEALNASAVSEFLGGCWREDKVRDALQRMGFYESGTIKPEVFSGLTPTAARTLQREVARVEKQLQSKDDLSEGQAREAAARRQKIVRETAETLAAHLRSGVSGVEFQEKAWDLAAKCNVERGGGEGDDHRRFSAIDAAARGLNAREFRRRTDLVLRYKKHLSPEAAGELRRTLLELAGWAEECAEQLG
jgi:ParB-like chromosome segregation protein Spo0J